MPQSWQQCAVELWNVDQAQMAIKFLNFTLKPSCYSMFIPTPSHCFCTASSLALVLYGPRPQLQLNNQYPVKHLPLLDLMFSLH